jgi:WD40 repeat protein
LGPPVWILAYCPDGKYLAGTSERQEGGHVAVWQLPSGKRVFHRQEPKGFPGVAFSPNGKLLVLGTFTENALVFDTATWKLQRQLPGHEKSARGAAFAPDGKTLAVTSYGGFIHLWDTAAWTIRKTLENAHSDKVYAVALTRDGTTLASCSADDTVKLWDLGSGENLHTFKHGSLVRRILFSPDDRHLIYTSWEGTLVIRERKTGNAAAIFKRYGSGDDVAVTRDGKWLAVVAGGAQLWRLDLGPADEALKQKVVRFAQGWDDDSMAVRDQASKNVVALGVPALDELRKLAKESPLAEVRIRARLARSAILEPTPVLKLRHPEGEIESLALAPDGGTLATGGPDGIVRVWSLPDGRQQLLLRQFPAGTPE